MDEYSYRPSVARVRVGAPVRFVNRGKIEHTVADTTRSGTIRSRLIRPRPLKHSESQIVTFRHPGVVFYVCTFHPTLMKGRLVVTR